MATATGTEWQLARQWLLDARVIPPSHPATKPSAQLIDFANCLRDGVYLCGVLNKLMPNSVGNYHPRATLQFKCVQNINAFLISCHRDFGVPEHELFEAPHLYDVSDFGQVVKCLSALSRSAPALRAGLKAFPDSHSTGYNDDEDIYGNLENIAMRTHLKTVGTFNNAQSSLAGYLNFPESGDSTGPSSGEESIYDRVPDIAEEEEDIYGKLVAYQQPPRPPAGSGFAGLPEKLGHVVAELVETEKNFVEILRLLSQHYIQALQTKLDITVQKTIFLIIPELLGIHAAFLEDLQKQLNADKRFSKCFLGYADKFVCYSGYCVKLPEAQTKVQELMDKPETGRLLEMCKKNSKRRFTLKDLLSVPMQRMLKYPLLIKELIKQGKKCDYSDVKGLEQALTVIQDVAVCVNETKRDVELIQVTKEAQNSLEGLKCDVYDKYGRLHADGEVKIKLLSEEGKGKTRYAFVFDKAVLVCKSKGDKFLLKELLMLEEFRLEDMAAPSARGKFTAAFQLLGSPSRNASSSSCIIYCKTAQDKREFVENIKTSIGRLSTVGRDSNGHVYMWGTCKESDKRCTICTHLLKGLVFQGHKSAECNHMVHFECLDGLQKLNCQRRLAVSIRAYTGIPQAPRGSQCLMFGVAEEIEVTSQGSDWCEGNLRRTGKRGIFPASFIRWRDGSMELMRHPWFAGKMSRAEAELQLMYSMDGTYMIRESEARPGDYALSIKYQLPKHIRVVNKDEQYFLSQSKVFASIETLVEYYQTNTLNVSFPGLDTILMWAFKDTVGRCVANYHFSARDSEELTIDERVEVRILSKDTPKNGWWYGECRGEFGLFPSNYVTELR